jgi:hypothetical protein
MTLSVTSWYEDSVNTVHKVAGSSPSGLPATEPNFGPDPM